MKPIDYFKLQAKNLFKDYLTKTPVYDSGLGDYLYHYHPQYFDVDQIFLDFDFDEDNFTLMKSQHIISQIVGFRKWTKILKATETELKLAKLIFDNQHKISFEEWQGYIAGVEHQNKVTFDTEIRLEIFTTVFANVEGHDSWGADYRLPANRTK